MTLIPAGIVGDLRSILDSSLTDTATIDTVDYPCRLDDGAQSVPFAGFPLNIAAHQWIMRFAYDMTVTPGAIATVASRLYVVREVIRPHDGIEVQAVSIELVPATGGCHLPAPETHQVTFTHKGLAPITVGVILGETNQNAMLGMAVAQYPWTVVVDQALTYGDGTTHVQQGDSIAYSPIPGVTRNAVLGKVSPARDAFLPVFLYGFKESD